MKNCIIENSYGTNYKRVSLTKVKSLVENCSQYGIVLHCKPNKVSIDNCFTKSIYNLEELKEWLDKCKDFLYSSNGYQLEYFVYFE